MLSESDPTGMVLKYARNRRCDPVAEMLSLSLLLLGILSKAFAAESAPSWQFDLKNATSGIVALESIVVSPTLVLFFDRKLLC